ncbi:MAG TPA: hypothetical protein VL997_09235 [Dyella sp.]|nr:hypothetical protein [Dyella sp.]
MFSIKVHTGVHTGSDVHTGTKKSQTGDDSGSTKTSPVSVTPSGTADFPASAATGKPTGLLGRFSGPDNQHVAVTLPGDSTTYYAYRTIDPNRPRELYVLDQNGHLTGTGKHIGPDGQWLGTKGGGDNDKQGGPPAKQAKPDGSSSQQPPQTVRNVIDTLISQHIRGTPAQASGGTHTSSQAAASSVSQSSASSASASPVPHATSTSTSHPSGTTTPSSSSGPQPSTSSSSASQAPHDTGNPSGNVGSPASQWDIDRFKAALSGMHNPPSSFQQFSNELADFLESLDPTVAQQILDSGQHAPLPASGSSSPQPSTSSATPSPVGAQTQPSSTPNPAAQQSTSQASSQTTTPSAPSQAGTSAASSAPSAAASTPPASLLETVVQQPPAMNSTINLRTRSPAHVFTQGESLPQAGTAINFISNRNYVLHQVQSILRRDGYEAEIIDSTRSALIRVVNRTTRAQFYLHVRLTATRNAARPTHLIGGHSNVLAALTVDPTDRQTLRSIYFLPL